MKIIFCFIFLIASNSFASMVSPKVACATKIRSELYKSFDSTDIKIGDIKFTKKDTFYVTDVVVKDGQDKYVMGFTVTFNKISCVIKSFGEVIEGVE